MRLAANASASASPRSELVLDFDDHSTDVYFIVIGDVRVLIRTAAGKEMILGDFGAGSFFGEMAAIDGAPALRQCHRPDQRRTFWLFRRPSFAKSSCTAPDISERLLRLLTSRVRELNMRLFERSVLDLRHRLYSELLRMSAPRKGHDGQAIISPPPFQHDLAVPHRLPPRAGQPRTRRDDGRRLAEKVRGGLVLLRPSVLEKRVREAMNETG